MDNIVRCSWAKHPLEIEYHDHEWGREIHDDLKLFELINLEGMQAGLSWLTILTKRENFREAFDGFDPEKIIAYDKVKIQELLNNPGIIRNRLKINAVIANAHAYFKTAEQYGSLNNFLWSYVDFKPIINHWRTKEEVPCETELSSRISKDMKKLGYKFVGPTIVYSLIQSCGIVNDHLVDCYLRHKN